MNLNQIAIVRMMVKFINQLLRLVLRGQLTVIRIEVKFILELQRFHSSGMLRTTHLTLNLNPRFNHIIHAIFAQYYLTVMSLEWP